MKKKWILLPVLASGALCLLSACGEKEGAEVKISSGSYVQDSNNVSKKGEEYLALKVDVKNVSGDKLDISDDNFTLKQGDKSISAEPSSIADMHGIGYKTLDKGASISGYVFFKVNPKDKYQLTFSPKAVDSKKDDKLKSTSVEMDASKYQNPGEEAKKAAKQYVDAVFLNDKKAQEKNDLTNNVQEDAKQYRENTIKQFRDIFGGDAVTDAQMEKLFDQYQDDARKRDEITYTIHEATPDKVQIEVVAKTVDFRQIDISKLASGFKEELEKKYSDDDTIDPDDVAKEAAKYVLDKMPDLISHTDVTTQDNSGDILTLEKKDKKWKVVTTGSDSTGYTSLMDQFTNE